MNEWVSKITSGLSMKWGKDSESTDDRFSLECKIIELESRLKIYEQSLKQIAETDTLEAAKRMARITLE